MSTYDPDIQTVPLPDPQSLQGWPGQLPDTRPANSFSGALEASHLVSGGAGRLYGFSVLNTLASAQFILVFDSPTLPADGAVPTGGIPVPIAASSFVSVYYGSVGRWFSRGIFLCNSTTASTKTLGAANCFFDAQYS